MKFEVKKIDGSTLFEADIDCDENDSYGIKLGKAIYWGYRNGISLKNGDFKKSILTDINFSGIRFEEVLFSDATFTRVSFIQVSFIKIIFDNIDFYKSTFDNASFISVLFSRSKLAKVRFNNSTFHRTAFFHTMFDEETKAFDDVSRNSLKNDLMGIFSR
jgi:uncharacterized protein YjbI with pentapeptide repeats